MKIYFILFLILISSVTLAQSKKEVIVAASQKYKVPLHKFHKTSIESISNEDLKETLQALEKLKENELDDFIESTISLREGEASSMKKLIPELVSNDINLMKYTDAVLAFKEAFQKLAFNGDIQTDILAEKPVTTPNPTPAPKPEIVDTPSAIDCKNELNKALDQFFSENREDFIRSQYRITSLKLAQKTKGSNKTTLEEVLKDEKSNLQNIKNSSESSTKLKELYKAYGFADDSKAISEIEALASKSNNLNYYKGTQRLLNEDLSAYIMANVADSKNTLFDEADAATAWLFDEMQKKYVSMGNKKFGNEFNLMNLSSSSYLLANGQVDINQSLSQSELVFTEAYASFLEKFKTEKKICFEEGQAFHNECDENLTALIEKGFAEDLQKLVKGMQSDAIKPEFSVDHLKIADSEISFKDLLSTDITTTKMPMPAGKSMQKGMASSALKPKSSEPVKKSAPKEIGANEFKSELQNAFKQKFSLSPIKANSNYSPIRDQELLRSSVGECSLKVTRLLNGKTRVEMYSPKNQVSYNLTLNTYILPTTTIPVQQIVGSMNYHYNKPHIRNSCLAN